MSYLKNIYPHYEQNERLATHATQQNVSNKKLRLLSYNVQIGAASSCYRHYLTHFWKHILPHPQSIENLDKIASIIAEHDIVALQEVDGGSLRSYFINHVEYLASMGEFPFWHQQTNRNMGRIAQHSNGLLSRIKPIEIVEHKLPGFIPGRGAMLSRYGTNETSLAVILVHLALSKRARMIQLEMISELVNLHEHVVLMGDFNCLGHSHEIYTLTQSTHLCQPGSRLNTYPSWKPDRNIDHILVSPSLSINSAQVLDDRISDHLPLAVEISLPDELDLFTHVIQPEDTELEWALTGAP